MKDGDEKMILYGPKNGKDLKTLYPELRGVSEFEKLTDGELLCVWWYSNPTSPLITEGNIPDKMRIALAYEEAFGADGDSDRRKDYFSFNFPGRIKLAIDRMRSYNPTIRIRSKNIVEKILQNFEQMVNVNIDDFKTVDEKGNVEINWTGRNNYVTSSAKISEVLPRLIEQVEQGFGMSNDKVGSESTTKAIHRFHSSNKD